MERLVMTPAEASKALSTSLETIMRYLSIGEIPAYREGRNWKIPFASLQEYICERAKKEAAIRRRTNENTG